VVLADCGHLSNLEQPERFNDVLLEFLQKHPEPGG
jgi:pimeloyl-ACP methyl ester carboxylesterase